MRGAAKREKLFCVCVCYELEANKGGPSSIYNLDSGSSGLLLYKKEKGSIVIVLYTYIVGMCSICTIFRKKTTK